MGPKNKLKKLISGWAREFRRRKRVPRVRVKSPTKTFTSTVKSPTKLQLLQTQHIWRGFIVDPYRVHDCCFILLSPISLFLSWCLWSIFYWCSQTLWILQLFLLIFYGFPQAPKKGKLRKVSNLGSFCWIFGCGPLYLFPPADRQRHL